MSVLFINASPENNGNTVALAHALLGNTAYDQLNLTDYRIYGYGQQFADDQFGEVLEKIKAVDVLVIGSPVYWHNVTGLLRNFLDRCYGSVPEGGLVGKRLFFLFQGAAPEKWMLEAGEYTMSRFAGLYGMQYEGMATSVSEAKRLAAKL